MPRVDEVGVSGLGQVSVPVADLPRAVGFYRDVLGLPLLFEVSGMAFFACGGVRLMLSAPEEEAMRPPGSVLYYRVDDIHAAHVALRQGGAELVGEPHLIARMSDHELWMDFFRDSEGNLAALMSEIRD